MRRLLPWTLLALALACAPEPDPSPDPDPTPLEDTAGATDVEPAPAPSVEQPAASTLTHADALALLRSAEVPVESIAGQDCIPAGEETTVAAIVAEAAATAEEQSTECTVGPDGESCTTRFLNNSGDAEEEFALYLGYRVQGGAIVEWRSCLFAG